MTIGDSFGEVLAAAKRGEEWAWSVLYRDLVGKVSGYVAANGASEPDDIASECFLQVARGLRRFEGDESQFRSWVFVIAHRRVLDARRSESRKPRSVPLPEDEGMLDRVLPVPPESEWSAVASQEELEVVLDQLSEAQRQVILLRVIGGFSVAETAAVMGKRAGAIKVMQHRALKALRGMMESGE